MNVQNTSSLFASADLCMSPSQDLRGRALEKIAALSASSYKQSEQSDFSKLYQACSRDHNGVSKSSASTRNGLSNGYAPLSSTPMVSSLLLKQLDATAN